MLLSSSNRKYQPFPLLSYFSMVVCLKCLLHHILSLIAYTFWENREFVFIIIVQFMVSANIRIRFGLQMVLVCLYSTPFHYHHCANLSEGIELIKRLSDIFCQVSKITHIFSVIYYTICGAVYFQFTYSLVMIERIYIICLIIIIKSEGHETMVSAVCLSIFLHVDCNTMTLCHIKMLKRKIADASTRLCSLPPTSETVTGNIKTAHYRVAHWLTALIDKPSHLKPTDYGWEQDEWPCAHLAHCTCRHKGDIR